MMPARSWSLPTVGDTVVMSTGSRVTGSAPYFRMFARSRASCAVKLPSIWADPPRMGSLNRGADVTTPSRTIAKALQGFAPAMPHSGSALRRVEASARARAPSASKSSETTQPTPPWGSTALAPVTLVPWMKAGSRLYFAWPATSQVPSHLAGSSGRPPV